MVKIRTSSTTKRKISRSRDDHPKRTVKKSGSRKRNYRPVTTDMSDRELESYLKPLREKGAERVKLRKRHKKVVVEFNELVRNAWNAGVPLHMIIKDAQISRQHTYSITEGSQSKKSKNPPHPTTSKQARVGKKETGKPRIQIRTG